MNNYLNKMLLVQDVVMLMLSTTLKNPLSIAYDPSYRASTFFRVWGLGGSTLWPKFSITCWMKVSAFFIHFGYSKWRAYVRPNKTHIAWGRQMRSSITRLLSMMTPALHGFSSDCVLGTTSFKAEDTHWNNQWVSVTKILQNLRDKAQLSY